MDEMGFHSFEGFLGENVSVPKILFLFREPNTPRVKEDKESFWFKRVLENEEKGTRYRNVLNRLAHRILYPEKEYTDDFTYLTECAYMNLRLDGGAAIATPEFYMVLEEFKRLSIEKCERVMNLDYLVWDGTEERRKTTAQQIAQDRMNILYVLLKSGLNYIVTTEDIYDAIKGIWERDNNEICVQREYSGPFLDGKDKVKKYWYCDLGQTRLISFAHPSNRRIKYSVLEEMTIRSEKEL